MPKIQSIKAREILDSRGFPTVEVDVLLEDSSLGRAAVPSGASTGSHEALELRDNDPKRYLGKGVRQAVQNVQKVIAPALKGLQAERLRELDEKLLALDGTENKSKLGANALLGVSLACARAGAAGLKIPLYRHLREAYGLPGKEYRLPVPMLNVLNGGKHADNGLAVQEFMIVPHGAPSFKEALRISSEIYQTLKKNLAAAGLTVSVGDEGGFAPRLASHTAAIEALLKAIEACSGQKQVGLAIDAAASEFCGNGSYSFEGKKLSSREMTSIYGNWAKKYPILSLEDGLAEDDWEGWKELTRELGKKMRLVGDDIFVTDIRRLKKGIESQTANAILIKPNQIGTLTETVEAVLCARKNGYASILSHRSGETEDPFIADLAVALGVQAIKTGAPCRSERLAKYNQLLRIEEELGDRAPYGPF